jgi:ribosomal protein S18 acetylase RimI-like enzyme
VTIRAAQAPDAPAIKEVVERAYAKYVERIGRRPGPMDDDYPALVAAGEVFVAVQQAIVGVLVLRRQPDHLLVENVAVDPAFQGQGYGRMLLDFAEDQARAWGVDELRLYTHQLMVENVRLYHRLGWQQTGRRTEHGFARIYFSKNLTAPGA